jgi:hypothetical protein
LGFGDDGVVFAIGPHRVFKIFKNKYAYDTAVQSMDRLFKTPDAAGTEAMIYDLGQFKPAYGITLYYYIMEKMAPLADIMDQDIIHNLLNDIKGFASNRRQAVIWKEMLADPNKINMVKQEIRARAQEIKETITSNNPSLIEKLNIEIPKIENRLESFFPKVQQQISTPNVLKIKPLQTDLAKQSFKLNPDWFVKLIEEILWKYATGRTDLHGGNIGVTSFGDLRYFDPTFYEPTNDKSDTQ